MSFLFYDFETTGADPRCDRPIQFAALRTNDELEPIDSPLTLYATLSPEVLPHPQAVLVTGILPQTLASSGGRSEAEFAALIHAEMMQPGTCAVGFNSLRFDAELLRFMFWRNLRAGCGPGVSPFATQRHSLAHGRAGCAYLAA
jgi:exodeoxyribonuclease-1